MEGRRLLRRRVLRTRVLGEGDSMVRVAVGLRSEERLLLLVGLGGTAAAQAPDEDEDPADELADTGDDEADDGAVEQAAVLGHAGVIVVGDAVVAVVVVAAVVGRGAVFHR